MTSDGDAAPLRELVQGLDLETKVRLVTSAGVWWTAVEPSIGLSSFVMADGPVGVRGPIFSDAQVAANRPSSYREDPGPGDLIDLPVGGDGLRYQVHEVHGCLRRGVQQSAVMSWPHPLDLMITLDRARAHRSRLPLDPGVLMTTGPYSSIRPGQVWLDTEGKRIQAHGGSVLHHDGAFFWYGENKERTLPGSGIWH